MAGGASVFAAEPVPDNVDQELRAALATQGFTGAVGSSLEQRLGRPLDSAKAQLGRLLFFDKFVAPRGVCPAANFSPRRLPKRARAAGESGESYPGFGAERTLSAHL